MQEVWTKCECNYKAAIKFNVQWQSVIVFLSLKKEKCVIRGQVQRSKLHHTKV